MRKARSFAEFEEHWREFLRRIDRIWNKAEAHYSRSPKWHGWSGKFKDKRSRDELLSYLMQARNTEEHSVADIVALQPGSIEIGAGPGGAFYKRVEVRDGQLTIEASGDPKVTINPARPKLIPVRNRGREYPVPSRHVGPDGVSVTLNSEDVPATAELALRYYEKFVNDAREFFTSSETPAR